MKKASAILTADLHFRDTQPTSRIDNFIKTQFEIKLPFILDLAEKHSCPILVAGDFFHKAKSSPYLEQLILKSLLGLPEFVVIPGQHDLPNHSLDQFEKSSLNIIEISSKHFHVAVRKEEFRIGTPEINYIVIGFPFGAIINTSKNNYNKIALSHQMVANTKYKIGKLEWSKIGATQAKSLLKKHPEFNLIVTGDNHQSFSEEYEGRLLVNPGSITRQTADQIDHRPRVALWYAEDNSIEWVYLPIEKDVFNTDHIDKQHERDERIEAFVKKLDDSYEVGLSFENNMETYLANHRTRQGVKQIIEEAMRDG